MRQPTNAPILKLGQTPLGVVFFMLFLMVAFPVYAAVTDGSIDLGALSYNSIVNDVMKNRCPFGDSQSYADYYTVCRGQNSCLPATEWFKSDTGFIPVEGIIVSNGASNKFYPRACYQANFQNNSTGIPIVPTVEGASTEATEIQAVTGASDISSSVIMAAIASGLALVIFYLVMTNFSWFVKLRLGARSRCARFRER